MRRTAQALFELEESLLDQHITNIKVSCVFEPIVISRLNDSTTTLLIYLQENAEMLRHEDGLLQTIEKVDDPTDDEMDTYAIQLAEFLDRKEELVLSLQSKLDEYKMYSSGEHQLAEDMNSLAC